MRGARPSPRLASVISRRYRSGRRRWPGRTSAPRAIRLQSDFVVGAGTDAGVRVGAFSEVIVALACVGTAVVLFPVLKRQNETAALGFVAARVIEASLILVGVVSILTLLTLRSCTARAWCRALCPPSG